jgi:hypothetical protein
LAVLSSLIARNVPFASGLAGNTRHTSPLVIVASRPKRAVSDSDACCEPPPVLPKAGIGIAAGADMMEGIGIDGLDGA